MKELFEILSKDIKSENFTRKEIVVYGIIAPICLIAACVVAEMLNKINW